MNLARCKKGHYYDGDKYASCPHCARKDNEAGDTVRMADNVDAQQTEQRKGVQGRALKDAVLDALEKKRESEVEQARVKKGVNANLHPVGILVVVSGVGQGSVHVLNQGCNYIKINGTELGVTQDGTDLSEMNASIAYHEERRMFVLRPIGEPSVVQVGRMLLKESIMLRPYDKFVIKDTMLLFVPICGEHFSWEF